VKIVRYLFAGGAAAVVDFGFFSLLTKGLGFPWAPIALFSFLLATLVNYQLSVRYVFESGTRFSRHHEAFLVFVVSGVGLALNQIILWLLIERAAWDMLIAKIVATGGVFFWNYGIRRNFIFKVKA